MHDELSVTCNSYMDFKVYLNNGGGVVQLLEPLPLRKPQWITLRFPQLIRFIL